MHLFVKILYRCFSYKYMHTCMHTYIRTYMYIHTIYSIFLNVCSSGFKKKWMMWCSMWMMWCHAMAYYVKPAVLWFALLPSAMLCYVPSCEAMYCHAMWCSVMPCCAVVFHIVIVRFHYALKCAVFCCAVLRCDMICCVVACYDMLCCVMLCCALSGPVCFCSQNMLDCIILQPESMNMQSWCSSRVYYNMNLIWVSAGGGDTAYDFGLFRREASMFSILEACSPTPKIPETLSAPSSKDWFVANYDTARKWRFSFQS